MNEFRAQFGYPPALTADAPGRVNLIGEHTDYNGGLVLPVAIPQRTRVALAPRADDTVRVWSDAAEAAGKVESYRQGDERHGRGWLDYVQGVTYVARADRLALRGFDAAVCSTVPVGSGLSSSAALSVSLLRALRAAFALPLDDVRIALLAQRSENDFVGAPVGVMDPMAASLAAGDTALFLDARSLEFECVPLPSGVELVVIHSGVSHRLAAGGGYTTRREECRRAAALLGVDSLRDLGPADLPRVRGLPPPLDRRVRHVVTENERVRAAVDAIRRADVHRLGALFFESHDSMRDDYEVSAPEVDLLVDLARADEAVLGARLTGGGFGGSVVCLARAGAGAACAGRLAAASAARSGRQPRILVPETP